MTETKDKAAQDQPATRTVVIGEKTDSPREVPLPVPVSRPEKRLLLIDGHSLAFRAFFALSRAAEYGGGPGFVTSEGVHTEGVYGFVNTMVKLLREEKPTHLVVSFDLEGPTLRSQEYGEYKGGRDETPEEFHGQVPNIQRILEAVGIPIVTSEGHEADDVLATLATTAAAEDFEVLVFSGDRDAFQMITDHVTVVYPGRTPSDLRRMDAEAVFEKYKVAPQNYPDLAALTGETADNLPGVPGVGPGFAAKWITAYGPVESLLEHADKITGKKGEALRENEDLVRRNRKLNRLLTDLPLDIDLTDAALPHADPETVAAIFDELEFGSQLRGRLLDAFGAAAADDDAVTPAEVTDVTRVRTAAEFAAWTAALEEGDAVVVRRLSVEPKAPSGTEVTSLMLTGATGAAVDLVEADQDLSGAVEAWLADPAAPKIVDGLKDLYHGLLLRGIELAGVVDDVQLSGYLVRPALRSYELEAQLAQHLDVEVATVEADSAAEQQGQTALDLDTDGEPSGVSDAELVRQATLGAACRQLSEHLRGLLEADGQLPLLTELEMPLAVILARMENAGIAIDRPGIDQLFEDLQQPIDQAFELAQAQLDHEINLGSTKQLQAVMFDELGLPKTKKTKTGFTTDAAAVADLLGRVDPETQGSRFLVALMNWREYSKLKQIVAGLRDAIAEDGRIHTTYQQTVAATGRLSSTGPNLQNIPVRTEQGQRIRDVFVVGEDAQGPFECLMTADYSQIEMRIMAHLSGDEGLIEAFRAGEDLHRFVGSRVFDVAPEDVTPAMRSKVKAMSYGLVYGLSSYGLSQQLNIGVDEARTMMSGYFERFGGVRDFLRGVVEEARSKGYTETIDGRRRYLPELTSDNRQARQAAERMALNAPIQGSAADIIKKAMIGVDRALREGSMRSRVLLQVHDELIVEVAPGEAAAVEEILRTEMAGAADLTVPLDVNVGTGRTWHQAAH
ncbi:DNA polymerase [Kocuria varians]|uniref:DNA polymerase I n=2 Tax=Micrococcales TaxID=85006 RepID=A0A4Y4D2N1_KOCVA|nr:DNA polymerase I [Kocuria varians]GEC98622.1 DNA polymerase [Kocuria varians]